MKISKKSWHYRLLKSTGWWIPANLCPYFWKVMFALVLAVAFGSGALVALTIMLSPIWRFFIEAPTGMPFVGGIADIAVLLTVWSEITYERRRAKRRARREREWNAPPPVVKERKPSLFREWLKAQHDKVCPLLDFTQ